MENIICYQSMKNEMTELRNENRKIVEDLSSTKASMNKQNLTIISLSDELETVKTEMTIYAKQERHMDSILETVQSLGQYNQMINESYEKLKIFKEKYNKSVFNKRNSNSKENNSEKMSAEEADKDDSTSSNDQYMTNTSNTNENVYNNKTNQLEYVFNNTGITNKLPVISDEMIIKTEIENPIQENIDGNLEKESNDQKTDLINQEDISMDFINESASQYNEGNIEKVHSQSSNLNTNVSSVKKPFKCDVCLKAYTHFSLLKIHLRIHTGERPFECNICEKTFNQSSSLKTHLRLHTGEKSFECTQCSSRFAQKNGLNQHLKTHTGK